MVPLDGTEMRILSQYKAAPPVRVVDAIRQLGIRYGEYPMDAGQSGFFRRTGLGFEIGVNSRDGSQRRRFTAAHELGHYVLHRDLLGPGQHFDRLYDAYARENPNEPFSRFHEVQANQFAADFLMPANLVARMYRQSPNIPDLANRFEVSLAAAEIRLKNLGLI